MIDVLTHIPEGLALSKKYILEELQARGGWQAFMYREESPLLRLIRPDGKVLEIFGTTTPDLPYALAKRIDDKFATYQLLTEHGLQTPETFLCTDSEQALEKMGTFRSRSERAVVKPLDASHGNGVTIGVHDESSLQSAWSEASKFSDKILIQKQIDEACDIRITVIHHSTVGAVLRTPARVIGDGTHTVGELIEHENKSSERGLNYTKSKSVIDMVRARTFLGPKLEMVPDIGEAVQVIGTANFGTGGELVDVTQKLPKWMVELSENVSHICGLCVCGIDFITKSAPHVTSTQEELDPFVIEVNKSPSLFLNDILNQHGEHPVTRAYVDFLATI